MEENVAKSEDVYRAWCRENCALLRARVGKRGDRKGPKYAELSRRCGGSPSTGEISALLNETRKRPPNFWYLLKLARALGVTLSDIPSGPRVAYPETEEGLLIGVAESDGPRYDEATREVLGRLRALNGAERRGVLRFLGIVQKGE
jgi:hypothetical protein